MYSNALPMAGSLLICSSKDTKNYKDCATSTKPKSTLLLNVSLELRYGDFQVGDPNSDHACWERPEDMDTPRPAFQVNTNRPGSDVAAETAAALAAASLAFRDLDSIYSARLLTSAIQVCMFTTNAIITLFSPFLLLTCGILELCSHLLVEGKSC